MPALIWGTGVGCEENYQRDFHDLFSRVEPYLHNAPIYRQAWTQTAPASNGPVKNSTPKVFTKLNPPPLKYQWNRPGSPSDRRATRARAPHNPPMRGGPEQGGSRGALDAVIRHDGRPRDSTAPVLQPAIKTGTTLSRQHWRSLGMRTCRWDTPARGHQTESSGSAIIKIAEPLGGL